MLNADRLTVKAAESLNQAISLARENGNPLVYDGHLLRSLLGQTEGIVVPLINKLGVDTNRLRERIEQEIARYPNQAGAQPSISPVPKNVLDSAADAAPNLTSAFAPREPAPQTPRATQEPAPAGRRPPPAPRVAPCRTKGAR